MNRFVEDPHWGWEIVGYFFLGGIAAGGFFLATCIDLFGQKERRDIARRGYLLAFPLIVLCGILLIIDLDHPRRFWHMLLDSETVAAAIQVGWPLSMDGWAIATTAPLIKFWSPMSIGSWAITVFGACSVITFWSALRPRGWVARRVAGPPGWIVKGIGCGVGLFVASYTGVLLSATNQPIWSDSALLGALFLASSLSTAAAAIGVCGGFSSLSEASRSALHRVDRRAVVFEAATIAVFLASLGSGVVAVLQIPAGQILMGVVVIGIGIPWLLSFRRSHSALRAWVAAACVLVGGGCLRYTVLRMPSEYRQLAQHDHKPIDFGPESGRQRGTRGADVRGDREVVPRSKVFTTDETTD